MRQDERRAQTRAALLQAAAEMFAEHGIAAASVDAIAQRAGRTVGALYGHFASKDELLFGVVDEWIAESAGIAAAELDMAAGTDQRLAALWRTVSELSSARWLALEHELWSYATRHPKALERLRTRYTWAWEGVGELSDRWPEFRTARDHAPAIVGVLVGMAMMNQVTPGAVPDEVAIETLRHLVGAPEPSTETRTPS